MTSPIKSRLFCTALLLSSLQFGFAQSQTSATTFSFGLPLTPVWDVSGYYDLTNHMQGAKLRPMDIIFSGVGIGLDAHGRLQGAGTMVVRVGDDYVGGDYKISGTVSGGGAKTKAVFSLRFKGNGTVAGVLTVCNISAKYNLVVDPVGRNLVGTITGNANFSSLGSGKLNSPIILPLPGGVDGGWSIVLDVFPFGNKISGTGVILVNSLTNAPQTALATKANGSLPKQDTRAKMKVAGYGNSSGTQVNMQFIPLLGATNLIATVSGKVLGQKVKNY